MYTYIKRQRPFRHLLIGIILVVLSVTVNLIPRHVQAYKSVPANLTDYPKLPGSSTLFYFFPDHMSSLLGISATGTNTIHAMNQWNETSRYALFDILVNGTTVTQTTNRMLAANFWGGNAPSSPCGNLSDLGPATIAVTCNLNVSIFLNSNRKWKWTNNGSLAGTNAPWDPGCGTTGCFPKYVHFLSAVLHELGHIYGLDHPTSPLSVMYATLGNKPTLTEDDRRGPAQFYGPYTSWEKNVALPWFPGYTYTQTMGAGVGAYQQNVTGGVLTNVSQESTVVPFEGSRYAKLTGTGNAVYSYSYMHLLPAFSDQLGSNPRHLKIVNGTTLSWYQYNHTQTKMSVDIAFTDGTTTLRDSGLTDQNGIRVHPAWRGSYNTGVWYYFTVNLSPLAGKTVKDIMIAYDSGGSGNGPTGLYKGYFDNLQINYQ